MREGCTAALGACFRFLVPASVPLISEGGWGTQEAESDSRLGWSLGRPP